ncbi:MAG: sigma-54 dependent transcriptional regulator, partial [bacterium]
SVPVLIQGPSGVGKELVALAVHQLSSRKNNPFVPINCGGFPDTLLDSELFGHCKGAFTGATLNKRGLIEEADKGTLFLDEIGEAPFALQVRLLRFLDNGRFRRVGEVKERSSDVRIIAATNKDLNSYIKKKKFREDLFYRLSVAILSIPPLSKRKDDIIPLVQHFITLYSKKMNKPVPKLHPQVSAIFQNYDWPGNVRELENIIEQALIVEKKNCITVEDLPPKFQEYSIDPDLFIQGNPTLEEIEKRYILSVLKNTSGNKKKAAEILNISRTTLISRLKKYQSNKKSVQNT